MLQLRTMVKTSIVDFEKETVADFNNLTDAEKEAAKAKIKEQTLM